MLASVTTVRATALSAEAGDAARGVAALFSVVDVGAAAAWVVSVAGAGTAPVAVVALADFADAELPLADFAADFAAGFVVDFVVGFVVAFGAAPLAGVPSDDADLVAADFAAVLGSFGSLARFLAAGGVVSGDAGGVVAADGAASVVVGRFLGGICLNGGSLGLDRAHRRQHFTARSACSRASRAPGSMRARQPAWRTALPRITKS